MSDTAADLEAAWAARVTRNADQVARVNELPDRDDFYAPTAPLFRADPHRTDDPVLHAILAHANASEVWIDIGAGGGRYALPLALRVREVIAVEPSSTMRSLLAEEAAAHRITNVRIIAARWPMPAAEAPSGDVAFISQVGYDVAEIGPFLDGMERAARRCVAVLMDESPPALAYPFWEAIHGEPRVPLPALDDLLSLLRARGKQCAVERLPLPLRHWDDLDTIQDWLRGQLWIAHGGDGDRRLRRLLEERSRRDVDGYRLDGGPREIGIVSWIP